MPTQLQLRRGTTTEHSTFSGAVGEVTVDTTKDTLIVHDGATNGGFPLAKEAGATFGNTNVTGNFSFADNAKAIFGAGSDLQIYHDGLTSYISDQGTGNLKILAQNFVVSNPADNKTMMAADPNAAATISYDGAIKLATTATGVDVTGGLNTTGNVGIGGVPVSNLDVKGSNSRIRWDLGNAYTYQSATNTAASAFAAAYYDGSEHRWLINSGTKAMIDNSGNLLVGKTNTTNLLTTAGHVFYGNGEAFLTRAGTPLFLSRTGSDGNIANFYKDGSSVGSIGVSSSGDDLYIGNDDVGLRFSNGGNLITPYNVTTQADSNGGFDLGYSLGRFKDLYLSGGVYLGGTGAANFLDDYEEGTWVPVILPSGGGSYGSTTGSGRYTKIGNTVHVWGYSKITNVTGGGPDVGGFSGLPFVGINDSFPAGNRSGIGIVREDGRTGILGQMFINGGTNAGGIQLYTGAIMLTAQTNDTFLFDITYKTNA